MDLKNIDIHIDIDIDSEDQVLLCYVHFHPSMKISLTFMYGKIVFHWMMLVVH